ncbi:YadA-like family protein [uncultured Megasphaera sp.]|uniref:YadA-like family protein n=1 Tax=uncultured Megasphaera sp. TaxID=165188 RepID=UPI0025F16F29|nr:YadA-like family protein [uncultured Megasphaera sp.]
MNSEPDIQRASVAIGYGASADNGNIAIGSYSDASTDLRTAKTTDGQEIKSYLTDKKADSYVSVGKKDALRRISNVADGADATDVATVGQLQALSKELGGYKAGFGIQIDPDSTDKTKNTISLNRNLGTNYTDKAHNGDEKVTVAVDDTGLVLGGYAEDEKGNKKNPAVTYGATGEDSVTVGGKNSLASGKGSVVTGGVENIASGATAVAIGGNNNDAIGTRSAVLGGLDNTAFGDNSMVSGGVYNVAGGIHSAVLGGFSNYALGTGTTSIGGYGKDYGTGYDSSVNGDYSVGVAGGSTGKDAKHALAAGNQAVVTTENGTAIGYQATTDEAKTIAFGHDVGDVSGYTIEWNKLPEGQVNADGTTNDYTKAPKSVTPTTYKDAYYNRLVKVADGVDAHDVVVMEQLTKATNDLTKDLSVNAGWGINVADEKDPKTGEVTKKNVISLNRNLGTNYGNKYGNGKVTFEADGENSLIIGGGAINDSLDERDKDLTFGAHAKDSALVGGMNNDIDKNSERALIVGGTNNKTLSTDKVQQTGTDAIIVGGSSNKAEGDGSLLIGGDQNEASGLNSTIIGGLENKNESWDASILGGYYNQITGISQASGIFGGDNNKVVNSGFTYILGGENNIADGGLAVIVGGINNRSSGLGSNVFGGTNNIASGAGSSVIGGEYNAATNTGNVTSGGFGNLTSGDHAYAAGGTQNYVTGKAASSLGGVYSSVNGMFSTGVAGGSTGQEAFLSLAAGYQSVVADGGAEKTYLTGADASKVLEDIYSGKKLPGYYMQDPSVETGPENPGRLIHYDKFSTALGYQATANKPGTIAFGHDAGDESGYTYEWETLTDEKGNPKQNMVDGTTNDYTKAPKSMKKNAPYTSAYYNRLVKVADGIDDHDVVVMEQLKQYAEKDARNIGNNLTVTPVYQTDDQGNIKLGNDNKPLIDEEKTEQKRKDAQTTNKNAWGKALGAEPFTIGTSDAATNASTSDQLVTGKTLYNYDAPTAAADKALNYVSANNTTGQNLSALDAQVKANADALDNPNHNIKYYSVKTSPLTVDGYTNEKNDGAKGMGSLAAGFVTHADGIASTVAGSYSGVINSGNAQGRDLRGAAALSYGTFNVNQNTDTAKEHSGVANSIVGQANMTTNSNAAIIYGAGNTVTDSYRPIADKASAILGNVSDPKKLSKAMQDAVKESGGQVMVMGGGNNVESAYMSQVVGVGNTVKGNQVENDKGEWGTDTSNTAIKYDPEKSSQYNYVDGFNNEVINGKHDYVIGANNKLSGDSYDDDQANPIKRSNKSNIVIGDNHTLTRKQNTVIIGSSDTENTQTIARDAVIIGHNANATSDTGADNAVAIGRKAKATGGNAVTIGVNTSAGEDSITIGSESRANSKNNIAIGRYAKVDGDNVTKAVALGWMAEAHVADGVAIGSDSIATVAGNSVEGYDPTTGQDSTDGTATWKATNAAVSIGKADGTVTRQINGVAAGTNDTDAVNVAQIKKLASINASNIGANLQYGADGTTAATDTDKTKNKEAWATAIGTGTVTKDDDGSKQMVTGSTVYNEVRPSKDGAYVKMSQTTGANLLKLDSQVKTNTDTLSDVNSRSVKYDTKTENGKTVVDNTTITLAGDGGTTITNLKNGVNDNDAATVGQLKSQIAGVTYTAGNGIAMDSTAKTISAKAGNGITVDTNGINAKAGTGITVNADGINVNTGNHLNINANGKIDVDDSGEVAETGDKSQQLVTGKTVYNALHGGLDNITVGKDGKDGKDGSIGIAGRNGTNGYTMTIIKTEQGTAGVDGKDGITRVVYQDKDGKGKHTFATLDDGLKFKGDDSTIIAKKLNEQLNITGGADSTKLTDKNIGVNSSTDGLKIQLAKNLAGITSIANQTTTGKGDAQTTTGAKIDLKDDGSISVNSGKITDVKSGLTATDGTYADTDKNNAANIGDVHSMIEKEAGNTDDKLALKANVAADNIGTHITDTTAQKTNLDNWGAAIGTGAVADSTNEHANQLVTGKTVYDALHGGLDNITVGKDGQNGKDGSIGIAGQNGKDGYTMTIIKTEQGTAGVDGKDGITRVVYQDKDGKGKHTFATLDDGLKFKGDDSTIIAKKLNEQLNITGGADSTKLTESNIGVNNVDGNLKVQLAQDLTGITSISNQTTTGDKTTGAKITLGTDGATTISGGDVSVSGNKITNIKAGEVKANSKDAVNGDQLYNEQQARTDADTAINNKIGTFDNSKTYNYIDKTASISTNLTTLDTHVKKNAEDISQINTRIDTLDGNAVKYDDSTKSKITLAGSNGTTIDHVKDGSVDKDSKEAVNGGQLNTEQQDRIAADTAINNKIGSLDNDGNYIKKDDSISKNLSTLDGQVKTNADAISKETTDREAADKAITDKIGSLDQDGKYIKKDATISQNLNLLDTQVKDNSDKIAQNTKDISEIKTNVRDLTDNAVQYDNDSKKSKITLAGEKGTTITNVKDGSVVKDSKDAVNGGQLFDEKTARENADTEIKNDITKIKDGEGFTEKGQTVIKSLAQDAVDVKGSKYVTVTNETKDGTKTFTVSVDGNGQVASGNRGFISGDTIYNELRPSADGSYIRKDSTTAQNLVSLDTQVKTTSDLIHTNTTGDIIQIGGNSTATKIDVNDKDGKGRVITGVVSDANDPNSAANVGYVNGLTAANTQQVYRDMNRAYGSLNNNINRAAAGSNALAALHPLDFDPADKASFAFGYGHYRNANAGAFGAFYQPNANTMVNFGITVGNGDPGFNAGVSFKLGQGSPYNGVSKAEMAQTIHDQSEQISAIKAADAAKDKRIDALEKENQEMKKQIQEIMARLNG